MNNRYNMVYTEKDNQLIQNSRLALLGTMSAGIMHDISTPLSASLAYIFILNKLIKEFQESINNPNVTQKDYFDICQDMVKNVNGAESSIENISNIINSVKNFTRNMSSDNKDVFRIKDIVSDIQTMISYELRYGNVDLTYNDDGDIKIEGDRGKISQVLTNFIMNSIQVYDGQGGRIEVNSKIESNETIIYVRDYGKGMTDDVKSKIFNEIFTTKGMQGTGLGMYTSNSIIKDSFNGRIWIQSELGKGTTVYISIPQCIK